MQNCKTCKWAKWQLTAKGNIRQGVAGWCYYPVITEDQIKLPQSSRNTIDVLNYRVGIWPDDGEECKCWEK